MPTSEEVHGPRISALGVYNGLNQGGMKVGDQGEPTATSGSVSSSLQMPTPRAVLSPNSSTSGVLSKLNQDGKNVGDQGKPLAISGSVPLRKPTPEAIYGPNISTSEWLIAWFTTPVRLEIMNYSLLSVEACLKPILTRMLLQRDS